MKASEFRREVYHYLSSLASSFNYTDIQPILEMTYAQFAEYVAELATEKGFILDEFKKRWSVKRIIARKNCQDDAEYLHYLNHAPDHKQTAGKYASSNNPVLESNVKLLISKMLKGRLLIQSYELKMPAWRLEELILQLLDVKMCPDARQTVIYCLECHKIPLVWGAGGREYRNVGLSPRALTMLNADK